MKRVYLLALVIALLFVALALFAWFFLVPGLDALAVDPIPLDRGACADTGIELLNYTERYDGAEILEMRRELKVVYGGEVKNCTRRLPPANVEVECRIGHITNEKDCFITNCATSCGALRQPGLPSIDLM